LDSIRKILEDLKSGTISINDAEKQIKSFHIEKIEELASFDLYREFRSGFPEVLYAEGKEIEDIIKISRQVIGKKGHLLISRVSREQFEIIKEKVADYLNKEFNFIYNEKGKLAYFKAENIKKNKLLGRVGIITAGTSDIYIAEEAKMIIEVMGGKVLTAYDVGISGIHRLFVPLKEMLESDVEIIIVVAGMEGTLPSVVASLVDVPVIGVPAPVGYGLGEKGVGALITMLQSCAPGLVVVNIGNGFGAAVAAVLFLRRIQKYLEK